MNPAERIPGITASLQKKVKRSILHKHSSDLCSSHLSPAGLVVEAYGSKSARVRFQSCSLNSKMQSNLPRQKIGKPKVKTQNWPPDKSPGPAIGQFSFSSYWQSQPGDIFQLCCHPSLSVNLLWGHELLFYHWTWAQIQNVERCPFLWKFLFQLISFSDFKKMDKVGEDLAKIGINTFFKTIWFKRVWFT